MDHDLSCDEEAALMAEEQAERRRINLERREVAYRLRHEEGLSFREIAQRIGPISRERVRQLVAAAERNRIH